MESADSGEKGRWRSGCYRDKTGVEDQMWEKGCKVETETKNNSWILTQTCVRPFLEPGRAEAEVVRMTHCFGCEESEVPMAYLRGCRVGSWI